MDLSVYHLEKPEFDESLNLYKSLNLDLYKNKLMAKSCGMRFLDTKEYPTYITLRAEFLPTGQEFYKFLNNVDTYFLTQILKNGQEWFGQDGSKVSPDTIDNLFKKSTQLPEKIPGLPVVEFIILKTKNKPVCVITTPEGRKSKISNLKNTHEIELLFCVDSILYHKSKCNLIYIVDEIRIINNHCISFEYLLCDSYESTESS